MTRHRNRAAAVAALLVLAATTTATAQGMGGGSGRSAPRTVANAEVFDLVFEGGTAIDYVEAIRKAVGPVNVVTTPALEQIRVEPIELSRVSVNAALGLLEDEYDLDDSRTVSVAVRVTPTRLEGARNVYRLMTRVHQRGGDPVGARSSVWSLSEITTGGTEPEHILTAIEAALDLYGNAYPAASLRFHRETGLLIARAQPAQIESIEELLIQLSSQNRMARRDAREIEEELQLARATVEDLQHQTMRLQTMMEVLRDEMSALQAERQALRAELTQVLMERDTIAARLQQKISALQEALDRRDDGGR